MNSYTIYYIDMDNVNKIQTVVALGNDVVNAAYNSGIVHEFIISIKLSSIVGI